ncbi:MAG: Hpt domain-containing protein [Saprospiraceae bacterium]|nr:Hpt domain-containing protein [Saprospiraceae bacterium]
MRRLCTRKPPNITFGRKLYPPSIVIDPQAIATYFGGDTSLLRKFAAVFIEEAPRLVNDMDEAFASGDLAALELHAHTLKSQIRYFGYADLVNCLQQIESLAEAREPVEALAPCMEKFNLGFPEVYKALADLVA